MKIKPQYIYIILVQIMFSQFGQNILQYEKFDWQYIQTKYFDIYFYEDGIVNKDFINSESEKAYKKISNYLNWELKDRYTIILHNSHNDFQQTNVINIYMQEGIGGVTELYKNRIVIPFDGSLSELKHVLHHEMVHLFINDMLYGGSVSNMIYSNVKPIPLWMNEGLAEYLSSKWNSNSEMWIRDIAINGGDFPHFNQLNGYLAYRGGHSIWNFIANKWGDEIIAEIFWDLKKLGNLNKVFENTLGVDLQGLLDLWHQDIKDSYWPEIKDRDSISKISEVLIDHTELDNSYNIAPFISPTGEKFTIYSNKSGNMGIYLVSTEDGAFIRKIIDGEQTTKFEELHILKPGVSWSPDGNKLVFAAKSGKSDALYILDIINNTTKKIRLELEGIFQPAWNPNFECENFIDCNDTGSICEGDLEWNQTLGNRSWDKNEIFIDENKNQKWDCTGKEIAFIGNNGLQSDIYIYNYQTEDLINLTDDWFSDEDPSWTIDGKSLYFISNRNNYNFTDSNLGINNLPESYDVSRKDIYTINTKNRKIIQITNTPWEESYPYELRNNNGIIYLSNQSGINNIYVQEENELYPLTNVATGITQFSIDKNNNQILFCGLENLGFNIYSITDPLRLIDRNIEIPIANWKNKSLAYNTIYRNNSEEIIDGKIYKNDYQHFVFSNMDSSKVITMINEPKKDIQYDNTVYNYDKPRFTLDFMQAVFGYDMTYNNTQGMAQILLSDMMGDYRIYINTEMEVDFKNSDYMLEYHFLPNRMDWFFKVYHYAYLFDQNYNFYADYRIENMGFNILSKYPLNRFERFEATLNLNHTTETSLDEENYFEEIYEGSSSIFQTSIQYVWDNSKWGGLHPVDGSRFYTKYRFAPKHSNFNYDFHCLTIDFRDYKKFDLSSSGFRLFAGKYWGNSPYKFKLGGAPWIASSQNRPQYVYDSNEHYFSEYVYPIRGTNLGSRLGSHVMLMNFEYRLPMLMYYFPTIQWLGQINGVFFTDIGVVWDDAFPDFNNSSNWDNPLENETSTGWAWTYGVGPRFIFLGMPWQLDYTWQYFPITGKNQYNGWYLSIGLDF